MDADYLLIIKDNLHGLALREIKTSCRCLLEISGLQ